MRVGLTRALLSACLASAFILGIAGCTKGGTETKVPILKAEQAASGLQQAFAKADPQVKNDAAMVSEALRTADYEKAVVSLGLIKARPDLSAEQRMALHEAQVTLTDRLMAAIDAGDDKAKRAYELMKRGRRD